MKLEEALKLFETYQHRANGKRYARTVTARVKEFLSFCAEHGAVELDDIAEPFVRKFLRQVGKKRNPGAWRSRYTSMQTFFHYLVFIGAITKEQNPLRETPQALTLTNKPMLRKSEFERLLLVLPQTHTGLQDQLTCLLLWEGYRLNEINNLTKHDVSRLPERAKVLAEKLIASAAHVKSNALFLTSTGGDRRIYGQKLNKRLQKYAAQAGLDQPERVTVSLIRQSGIYHRYMGAVQISQGETPDGV